MLSQIHFLNTGHSDCIILESNGHFAMIDSGEDNDYPPNMPHLKLKGYEDIVVAYLFKHCSNDKGDVVLDFILGTHCHSDHIGGFDTVILNPNITVKKAYLKHYEDSNVFIGEQKSWDNQTVYNQMCDALKKRNVQTVKEFDNLKFKMGDFDIEFINGTFVKQGFIKYGENINSVVTKVDAFGKTALLMGDMNNKTGIEQKIGKAVGKVDVLKVGHHGHIGSTSLNFVKSVKPDISVITNEKNRVIPTTVYKLTKIAKSKIYYTPNCNGLKIEFNKDGLNCISDIMD